MWPTNSVPGISAPRSLIFPSWEKSAWIFRFELSPGDALTTDIAVAAAVVLGLPWVVSGFRPN
jgi:hypothetical protein